MNTRTLGVVAIICSPFLCIDFYVNGLINSFSQTIVSDICNLIYTAGWMCSIVGLWHLKAAGTGKAGKSVLLAQLVLLALSIAWSAFDLINPGSNSILMKTLDTSWTISNIFMIVTGIVIAVSGGLKGWKKFIPLVTGLWLPVTLIVLPAIIERNDYIFIISSFYSVAAWLLLGLTVYLSPRVSINETVENKLSYA